MKKVLPSLVFFLVCATALTSARLSAQESPEPSPVHVGTQNPYKIGTQEQPVYAPEYVYFLKQKATHEWYICWSSYFDPLFMDENKVQSPQSSIIRETRETMWIYSVVPGHEYDIIDAVKEKTVQQQFEAWRRNPEYTKCPTLEEDCVYINRFIEYTGETLAEEAEDALAISKRYPTAVDLFDKFQDFYRVTSDGIYVTEGDCSSRSLKVYKLNHIIADSDELLKPAPGEQYLRLHISEIYNLVSTSNNEPFPNEPFPINPVPINPVPLRTEYYQTKNNATSWDLQSSDLTISRTPPSENH
jgi:hypothetical protein